MGGGGRRWKGFHVAEIELMMPRRCGIESYCNTLSVVGLRHAILDGYIVWQRTFDVIATGSILQTTTQSRMLTMHAVANKCQRRAAPVSAPLPWPALSEAWTMRPRTI